MELNNNFISLRVSDNDQLNIDMNANWLSPAVKLSILSNRWLTLGVEDDAYENMHDKFEERFEISIMKRKDIGTQEY
jgi:hypothetical protein